QNAVEVLKLSRPVSDRVDRCSEMIDRQLVRMTRLLDDLVDVSRLTRGPLDLRLGRADLRSVIEQALQRAGARLTERHQTLVADLPPAGVEIEADAPRLVQLIEILLDNAAKFSDEGGTITIGHAIDDGDFVLTIMDTGIGIDSAIRPLMFQPFRLAGSEHNTNGNGLGLGLPLAQGIAHGHGGRIEAWPREAGQGSVFTVRLPLLRAAAVPAHTAPGHDVMAAGRAPKRWRLVLADDRQLNADALSELIRLQGHEVITVYDGEAAVAAAERSRPNAIVLDIGMPGVDGFETCRRIRSQSWARDIPIVALTGWGQSNIGPRAREAGFTFHLLKPVDHLTLLSNLERMHVLGAGFTTE
ncbi:MAG: ATP-binding protein, partial [Gemmatimonadota bacterium]